MLFQDTTLQQFKAVLANFKAVAWSFENFIGEVHLPKKSEKHKTGWEKCAFKSWNKSSSKWTVFFFFLTVCDLFLSSCDSQQEKKWLLSKETYRGDPIVVDGQVKAAGGFAVRVIGYVWAACDVSSKIYSTDRERVESRE